MNKTMSCKISVSPSAFFTLSNWTLELEMLNF
jgi:hypothetical protein